MMAHVQREVELKYAADDAFELPALTEILVGDGHGSSVFEAGPLSEGEVARQRLDATYFDTADLRLATAGVRFPNTDALMWCSSRVDTWRWERGFGKCVVGSVGSTIASVGKA